MGCDKMLTKSIRTLILMLVLAAPGWCWAFNYSATTSGAPTWNRPVESLSGLSIFGTNVEYHVQSFVAPVSASYTINSIATGGWDNFLVLYQGAFNAASPLTNVIAGNDDFGFIGQSRIVRSLTAGTTYNVVTTGFFNSSSGAFSNSISTPTPEPATWMLVAAGAGFVAFRRRRSERI
jgi:hypothetical protein